MRRRQFLHAATGLSLAGLPSKSAAGWALRSSEAISPIGPRQESPVAIDGLGEGIVYYPQNATPLERDIGRLNTLWDMGVRIMQLTYNHRNLLGDGSSERTNAGLSEYGIEVVEHMNEIGMVVDVSHSGRQTTLDAIQFSSAPIAITHAGCASVFQHSRNKTDLALKAMADKGGLIGMVQLMGPFGALPGPDYHAAGPVAVLPERAEPSPPDADHRRGARPLGPLPRRHREDHGGKLVSAVPGGVGVGIAVFTM